MSPRRGQSNPARVEAALGWRALGWPSASTALRGLCRSHCLLFCPLPLRSGQTSGIGSRPALVSTPPPLPPPTPTPPLSPVSQLHAFLVSTERESTCPALTHAGHSALCTRHCATVAPSQGPPHATPSYSLCKTAPHAPERPQEGPLRSGPPRPFFPMRLAFDLEPLRHWSGAPDGAF